MITVKHVMRSSMEELEEHDVEQHFLCVECSVFQDSQEGLETHRVTDHFYCDPCQRFLKTQAGLVQHDEARHSYCTPCDRYFPSNAARRQHRVNSSSHNFCEECEQDFDDMEGLEEHQETVHNWCGICNMNIAASVDLDQHRVDVHHYCIPCTRYFESANHLRQHLRSAKHKPKSFICPMRGCSAGFVSLSALIAHAESGGCPSRVTRRDIDRMVVKADVNGVITDRKRITGPDANKQYPFDDHPLMYQANERAWNGASYECFLCHKTFKALPHLNAHLASPAHVTGAKVYHCPPRGCGAKFITLSALMRHIEDESCGVRRFRYVERAIQESVNRFSDLGRIEYSAGYAVVD